MPLVEGGVVGLERARDDDPAGETRVLPLRVPGRRRADAPRCAEAGVLGPAAGVIGSLQALEALKLLTGAAPPLRDAFLQVDLATLDVLRVQRQRRADCPDCGDA